MVFRNQINFSGTRGDSPASADFAQQIVEAIREAVSNGRLWPGAKLGEGQIAEVFSTSRTVVRQALQQLSYLGIVRLEANRGAFVASATRKEAADLYAARRVIESETVAILARHCTANDIRALRMHLSAEQAARDANDRQLLLDLRSAFHLRIAELAGNSILVELLAQILPRTAMIARFYRSISVTPQSTKDDHAELIELLVSGNAAKCVQLMHKHLDLDEQHLLIPETPKTGRVNLGEILKAPKRGRLTQSSTKNKAKVPGCC